jgi:hypothetical protein
MYGQAAGNGPPNEAAGQIVRRPGGIHSRGYETRAIEEAMTDPPDLRLLADRLEITSLGAEFTDAIMQHDYDRFAGLFTPQGAWRMPHIDEEFTGRAAIRAAIERLQSLWQFFVQNAHPGFVRIDGDEAYGRVYIVELGRMRDRSEQLNYSLYHDRYERTSEGWRFAERRYEVRYLDTSPLPGSPAA